MADAAIPAGATIDLHRLLMPRYFIVLVVIAILCAFVVIIWH